MDILLSLLTEHLGRVQIAVYLTVAAVCLVRSFTARSHRARQRSLLWACGALLCVSVTAFIMAA